MFFQYAVPLERQIQKYWQTALLIVRIQCGYKSEIRYMKIMVFITQNKAFTDPMPITSDSILKERYPVLIGVAESSGVKK